MRFVIFLMVFQLLPSHENNDEEFGTMLQEDVKAIAFTTLQTKCNICHATKKRTDIFTLQNMDSLATDIWKQVFVKKKMPKGRKVKLTEEESKALHEWLDMTLAEDN